MRNSMEEAESDEIKEVKKNISGRRSIRDNYMNYEEISSRKINKDRSISEPPKSYSTLYMNNNNNTKRLKTIREKQVSSDDVISKQGSSDDEFCIDDDNFSKSNSQLNESDLDLDIESAASHTPTLLGAKSRRINSETNLNDSKRRLSGFMGNRSKRFCASTSELSFTSHLDTHKSLFSPKNNHTSRSGSLYGSSMSLNSANSRLFVINSPFYNGKTTFGGAASYPKRDINQSKVLRTPIQMRPSSSLSNSSNTSTKSEGGGNIAPESNAAKRILEIMTQFSGPLKETRSMGSNISSMIKIPGLIQGNKKRFGEEDLQLDRSISLTRPTAPYTRPIATSATKQQPESPAILLNNSKNAPQIPTMSQLLKMKRLQNNTERAREIANRSENFLNQVHEYKLPSQNEESQSSTNSANVNSSSSSSSFKMKSNITKNLLRNVEKDDLPPTPVNLPNIQLPELKSIPKFDIKLPESTKACSSNNKPITSKVVETNSSPLKSACSQSAVVKDARTEKMAPNMNSSSNNFIFSKPVRVNISEADTKNLNVSTDSFKFSRPIFIEELDIEGNSSSKTTPVSTKPLADDLFKNIVAKQQKSQWECTECMVRNDMDRTRCLSCDTLKRDSGINSIPSKDSSETTAKNPPTDDLFKKLAAQQKKSQWECAECMTKNELDKDKCLCCETPKPGAKNSVAAPTNSHGFQFGMPSTSVGSDDLFKNLAAQQKKSQWECTECMTSNDMSKEKCVCCETLKPGSNKSSNDKSSKISTSGFSFGMKSSANEPATPKFSFGMPASSIAKTSPEKVDPDFKKLIEKQNANWECSACMTRNDQTRLKCICCEQVKPSSSDTKSDFSFGNKMSSTVSLPAPSEVKFSFGIVPTVQTLTSDSTVNVANKENDETKKVEKIDEVDKPKQTFSFGATSSSSNTAFSASSFTFKSPSIVKSPATEEKKPDEKEQSNLTNVHENKIESDKKTPAFGSKIESVPDHKKTDENTEQKKSSIGGFSFPITETVGATNFASPKTNGGFSFGTLAKSSDTTTDSKSSSGFQFSSGTNLSFTSNATSSTVTLKPSNSFTFGSQKLDNTEPQKSTVFGTFGSASQGATNLFENKDQASKKDETASPIFAFGNAKSTSSNMIFGSSINAAPSTSITPMFGANSSAPTFGTSSINNNNESGFGSKMADFGSIQTSSTNQSQKRAFDFGSSDVPQKKFDSGQQLSSAPFQFNAQQDGVKPAFSFSATSTPQAFSFNATNSSSTNNIAGSNVQAQPQQPASAPVMQFGAAPTVAIPGINTFGTAQSAAGAPQRKILKAARRTVRR